MKERKKKLFGASSYDVFAIPIPCLAFPFLPPLAFLLFPYLNSSPPQNATLVAASYCVIATSSYRLSAWHVQVDSQARPWKNPALGGDLRFLNKITWVRKKNHEGVGMEKAGMKIIDDEKGTLGICCWSTKRCCCWIYKGFGKGIVFPLETERSENSV